MAFDSRSERGILKIDISKAQFRFSGYRPRIKIELWINGALHDFTSAEPMDCDGEVAFNETLCSGTMVTENTQVELKAYRQNILHGSPWKYMGRSQFRIGNITPHRWVFGGELHCFAPFGENKQWHVRFKLTFPWNRDPSWLVEVLPEAVWRSMELQSMGVDEVDESLSRASTIICL